MKAFSLLTLVTLAASWRTLEAAMSDWMGENPCLKPSHSSYRCTYDGEKTLDLRGCDITGNHFRFLHECYVAFGRGNVEYLKLNDNPIHYLHNLTFNGLPNLKSLHLQRTELVDMNFDAFVGLESLNRLFLQGNELTTIDDGTFDYLESVKYVNLKRNPLQCMPTMPTSVETLRLDDGVDEFDECGGP